MIDRPTREKSNGTFSQMRIDFQGVEGEGRGKTTRERERAEALNFH